MPPISFIMSKPFLRELFAICCFMTVMDAYSQSFVLNPTYKDSLSVDSISYKVSGVIEFGLNDSLEFQLDLVEIHPDSLHVIYHMESGFNQSALPTNNVLSYDPASQQFEVSCGIFANPDLMIHLLISKDGEKVEETYFK